MKTDYLYFEEFVYDVLIASKKYSKVERIIPLANRQLDILAKKNKENLIFEIKLFSAPIPVGLIDQVYGKWLDASEVIDNLKPYIISLSPYSQNAIRKAKKIGVNLWGIEDLKNDLNDEIIWNKLFDKYKNRIKQFTKLDTFIPNKEYKKSKETIFIDSVKKIDSGKNDWSMYQQTVYDIFEHLLCPPLDAPKYELADRDKRNRRDIIFENNGENRFWKNIKEEYKGHYIVIDAKNYTNPLSKRPIIDIAHYLKPYGCGMFGIIVSRKGLGAAGKHARKEQWFGNNKMIIVLSDQDVYLMLEMKEKGENPEEIIREKISKFRMQL